MRWVYSGIPLVRIKGIAVSVHLTLLLVIAYWFLTAWVSSDPLAGTLRVGLFAAVLFGSILLHELGHCYGAYLTGGESESILLWPLGGMATTTGGEKSPYDEFVVVLLGPAVSLALALTSTMIVWLWPEALASSGPGGAILYFWEQMQWVNWMLFIFNMVVPLFPMDCARLIRSAFSMKYDPQRVTYRMCLGGLFVAGLMVCLSFVALFSPSPLMQQFNIFLLLIAVFGLQSCLTEMKYLEFSDVYTDPEHGRGVFQSVIRRLKPKARSPRPAHRSRPAESAVVHRSSVEQPESDRDALLAELDEAVTAEDFVRAARIRDQLRSLTAESHQH